MIPNPNISDSARAAFLHKLDGSDLNVSAWEWDFLHTFMAAGKKFFWTDGRRVAVDKMQRLYGNEPEIKMPVPLAASQRLSIPSANKHCCMFLKRDEDRRIGPCNEPGTLINRKGFIYCTECGESARKALKRRGVNMELQPYTSNK